MDSTHTSTADSETLVKSIHATANDMSGWLKFLGAVQIAIGIPSLIGLIGALYIWLGILLWQAGTAAESNQPEQLTTMMSKLKTVFIVTGVLAALGLVSMIVMFLTIGGGILTLLQQ